jgi:hypothetical protein
LTERSELNFCLGEPPARPVHWLPGGDENDQREREREGPLLQHCFKPTSFQASQARAQGAGRGPSGRRDFVFQSGYSVAVAGRQAVAAMGFPCVLRPSHTARCSRRSVSLFSPAVNTQTDIHMLQVSGLRNSADQCPAVDQCVNNHHQWH